MLGTPQACGCSHVHGWFAQRFLVALLAVTPFVSKPQNEPSLERVSLSYRQPVSGSRHHFGQDFGAMLQPAGHN